MLAISHRCQTSERDHFRIGSESDAQQLKWTCLPIPSADIPLAGAAGGAFGLLVALLELRRLASSATYVFALNDADLEAKASQMAPQQLIVRGEQRAALVLSVLFAWQLCIALAEELYYRGLVQLDHRVRLK